MTIGAKGVAFKVTYNDGGARSGLSGFNGVCSDRIIHDNIRIRKMTNCSAENSPCRRYADENFKGQRPRMTGAFGALCYESTLFSGQQMRFSAGFYHRGTKAGTAIPMTGVDAGDVALLTTLLPATTQAERVVFGCFRVKRAVCLDPNRGYTVESDGTMDLKFPDELTRRMNFWRYFRNQDGSQDWRTGLFRHLSQESVDQFIADLLTNLGDRPERDQLVRAIGDKLEHRPTRRLPILADSASSHGFGGGESAAHLELKLFVAKHPERIGIPCGSVVEVEYPYLSGDQVDLKFDLPDGTAAVVEIETVLPLPGAHQCIKYRALLEAQRGQPLGSGQVQAILVAHGFDEATRDFAQQYGIRLVKLKV